MKSYKRAGFFLSSFVAFLAAGLLWHFKTTNFVGDLPLARDSPLQISVYLAKPDDEVSLTLEIETGYGPSNDKAVLFVSTSTTGAILVTSNRPQVGGHDFESVPDSNDLGGPTYVFYEPHAAFINDKYDSRGLQIASFHMRPGEVLEDEEGLNAQMPQVALNETGQQSVPAIASISNDGDGSSWYTPRPGPGWHTGSRRPFDYGLIVNRIPVSLMWEPKRLSTSEGLNSIGDYIVNSSIDVDLPSSGTLVGDSFVWHGSYGLAPLLITKNQDVQQQRERDEFYSGLAIATAAAAMVAFVQEFPDERSKEIRRSERDSQGPIVAKGSKSPYRDSTSLGSNVETENGVRPRASSPVSMTIALAVLASRLVRGWRR